MHRLPSRPRALVALTLLALTVTVATGCGRGSGDRSAPASGNVKGSSAKAAEDLGFPTLATKNTTRIATDDPVAAAAATSRAVYAGAGSGERPAAVALVQKSDWRSALAAASLMSRPVRAPLLLADGRSLPPATRDTLVKLAPAGSKATGGAQVIRIGDVPAPARFKSTDLRASTPFGLARSIDAFSSAARSQTTTDVLVVSADAPQFAAPAAALSAKSGTPILFVHRDSVPADTVAAIKTHQRPKIFVLGPSRVISPKATRTLRKLGEVTRVGGQDPVSNSIAFARYSDGDFGWGVVDPGHGLVFTSATADPTMAGVVAPLSATGSYGPMLQLAGPNAVTPPLRDYLADIQPGYEKDPVRGVYNRAWIVGDDKKISSAVQSTIDGDLEIVPVQQKSQPNE